MSNKTILYSTCCLLLIISLVEGFYIYNYKNLKPLNPKQHKNTVIFGSFSRITGFKPPKGYDPLPGYQPENGIVPDYKTAIRLAETIWLPIFGSKIYDEAPFNAAL